MTLERDWYGRDWKILRSNLIKLCLHFSDDLLTKIGSDHLRLSDRVNDYFESIMDDIQGKISHDRIGLWKKALPLLAGRQRFTKWLKKDQEALSGKKLNRGNPISPRQALARKLWQHFELTRREQLAAGRGVSVNRIKTWERLDRISREVAGKNETDRRCTEEHFRDLAAIIKEKYANDNNLPRKINTIHDYFHQFSDDCLKNVADIENINGRMDTISINDAKGLLHGLGMAELLKCLKWLSSEDFETIDVAFKLGLGKVRYMTVRDFLRARSLNTNQYEKKRKKIMEKLRNCLEFNLERQFEENGP